MMGRIYITDLRKSVSTHIMSTCKRSGRVSVDCWGWISHEGAKILHPTEGHLDALHYQHIFENVTVPSVWMLYPEFLIHSYTLHFMNLAAAFGTHTTHKGDIHTTGGIRTHNLSRRGAVDRPATRNGEISHLLIENEK